MIVWLASYPRSGNTFLRVLLNNRFGLRSYSLYNDLLDIAASKKTAAIVGHRLLPANFEIQKARKSKRVYFIKTHGLPPDPQDKAIYLVRDGRECIVSYARYQQNYNPSVVFAQKVDDLIRGYDQFGAWGNHLRAWAPESREQTLFLRFETLVSDPATQIEALAEFLERPPNDETTPTFEELKARNQTFFRSGKLNTWQQQLSVEQQQAFWLRNADVLERYGYLHGRPEGLDEVLQTPVFASLLQDSQRSLELQWHLDSTNRKLSQSLDGLTREVRENSATAESLETPAREQETLLSRLEALSNAVHDLSTSFTEHDRTIVDGSVAPLREKLEQAANRLAGVEQQLAGPLQIDSGVLTGLAERVASIESTLSSPLPVDPAMLMPLAEHLEAVEGLLKQPLPVETGPQERLVDLVQALSLELDGALKDQQKRFEEFGSNLQAVKQLEQGVVAALARQQDRRLQDQDLLNRIIEVQSQQNAQLKGDATVLSANSEQLALAVQLLRRQGRTIERLQDDFHDRSASLDSALRHVENLSRSLAEAEARAQAATTQLAAAEQERKSLRETVADFELKLERLHTDRERETQRYIASLLNEKRAATEMNQHRLRLHGALEPALQAFEELTRTHVHLAPGKKYQAYRRLLASLHDVAAKHGAS